MIQVENIGKRYRLAAVKHDMLLGSLRYRLKRLFRRSVAAAGEEDFWALRNVTFSITEGEVVGIIGRNGAGKSTLLKILSRITPPTEGRIRLRGRVASLLEVGTGFNAELTGRANIFMNGAILGMSRREIRSKLDEIVAFSEVGRFIDTPVKHYSSGMYVRLAFAVAAHLEPEILVVDEVLAVGDAEFQRKCLGKMNAVARGGRTVLFVSHNMAAVEHLCSRAVLLDDGRLCSDGSTTDVISEYYRSIRSHEEEYSIYALNRSALDAQSADGFSITNIQVLGKDGQALKQLHSGDGVVVRIHYHASRRFMSPAFAVSLHSVMGQELLRLNTRPISGYDIPELDGEGYIDLNISSLPLTGGTYYLEVGFARERRYWIVRLEDVLKLTVQSRDVYGSGMALDNSRGYLITPHHWELHEHPRIGAPGTAGQRG